MGVLILIDAERRVFILATSPHIHLSPTDEPKAISDSYGHGNNNYGLLITLNSQEGLGRCWVYCKLYSNPSIFQGLSRTWNDTY